MIPDFYFVLPLQKFLDTQWAKKEELLRGFIKNGHFTSTRGTETREVPVRSEVKHVVIPICVLLAALIFVLRMLYVAPVSFLVMVGTYTFMRWNARRLDWDYST